MGQDYLNTQNSLEKSTIFSLKIAIHLKSIKLKTEDTFHTILIWLITSNHLNLLFRCHKRVVLFLFSLCLFFISFSFPFFPPLSSYTIFTTFPFSCPPSQLVHLEREKIYHYNTPKKHFYCLKLSNISTCMLEQN